MWYKATVEYQVPCGTGALVKVRTAYVCSECGRTNDEIVYRDADGWVHRIAPSHCNFCDTMHIKDEGDE